jgi:hypothetical protein
VSFTRIVPTLASLAALSLLAVAPIVAGTRDDSDEVRVAGVCNGGAASRVRLKGEDGEIEVRFRLDSTRSGVVWRVVLVQERRVAWRANLTTRRGGSFEVRRVLRDLPGADTISARAVGPGGLVCRAAATLPGP